MHHRGSVTPERLLADLTEPQREAVTHVDGPLLILAGPGSGKTRVITRRAAHLAATATSPRNILAITFTNKAAKEMRERMDELGAGSGMTVCTFHALGAKLLRQYHDRADIPRNFTIHDRDDRRKLLKEAIETCGLSTENWAPAAVEQSIGHAKNQMLTASAYADQCSDWREQTIARIYTAYEERLAQVGGLDFDDLLMRPALLLARDTELRDELEQQYRYVLIDEYQDTNAAQYTIARLLSKTHENLCATGDPDQSIYGWRGADIQNILSFERDYPGARVVRLEQNYRSTKRILRAADALIGVNVERKAKALWTENEEGPLVRVIEVETGEEEAAAVARDIAERRREGTRAGDIAIFYRVNSMSRAVEEALLRCGIEYQIARGTEFYNRKEIKDILAYLRILVNPADDVALLRIINTPPRGIGQTTVRRLVEQSDRSGRRLVDLLTSGDGLDELGRSAEKVRGFVALLGSLAPALDQPAPQALEFVIAHSGIRAMYHNDADADADDSPAANLDELVTAVSVFQGEQPEATLVDWLEHTALVSDVDGIREEGGAVTLMTLHTAKGLEFEVVYIVGLEEGLLPFRRHDRGEPGQEEEERRLCFVGMTRAKRRLTLSRGRYRMLRGVTQRTIRSPYLDELPEDVVEWIEPRSTSRKRSAAPNAVGLPRDLKDWSVGTLVRHPIRGIGQVLALERGAKRTHVDVEFKDGTRQSWVLEFAQLERVDFDDVG